MRQYALRHIWVIFTSLALVSVVSTLAIEAINFSPVPFWDMWEGYVAFNAQLSHDSLGAWFAQHNEHRIVLARLLFWIDLHLFNGTTHFLIIFNLLLAGMAAATFSFIAGAAIPESQLKALRYSVYALLTMLCFSWAQHENFNWGFQSQFFAAQSLPLLALFLLWNSENNKLAFLGACLAGVASAGTMANGVLALPCMVVLSVLLRQGSGKFLVLVSLTGVTLYSYFNGYHAVSGHGSITEALHTQPLNLLRYVFLYLGSPVFHLGGDPQLAKYAGLFICLSSVGFAFSALKNWRLRPLTMCLVVYLAYLGATALGTAGGRLIFGLDQALSSRYTTPALMAWCSVLILYVERWRFKLAKSTVAFAAFSLMGLALLPAQWHALKGGSNEPEAKMLAALALEMNIEDKDQIQHIYPSYERAQAFSADARRLNQTIFANESIRDISEQLGQPYKSPRVPNCSGSIDRISDVNGAPEFRRIEGWIFAPQQGVVPKRVWILNSQKTAVGYAFTGIPREDVAQVVDVKAGRSGFIGYVRASEGSLALSGENPDCIFRQNP